VRRATPTRGAPRLPRPASAGEVTPPIRRRKLCDEIAERLMARIRDGALAPGEPLPSERELMDLYGVGRPSVREALQALEHAGIVEISHGERARVAVPSAEALVAQVARGAHHLLRVQPETLPHVRDARVLLEVGTARRAAERATPDDVRALRARLDAQRVVRERQDAFVAADMAFHRELARISGNPIFPALVEALFDWARTEYRALVRAPGAEALTLEEHGRLVAAIEAGDADAAEAAMRAHLTRSDARYGARPLASPRRTPGRPAPRRTTR
jgi:DNA-binding FadR family transcriptional regulator